MPPFVTLCEHTYIGGNPVPSLRGCLFLDDCKLFDVLFHQQRHVLRRMRASIDTPWRGHDHRAIAYDNDQIYKTAWALSKILTPTLHMHVTDRPFGYSLYGGKPSVEWTAFASEIAVASGPFHLVLSGLPTSL